MENSMRYEVTYPEKSHFIAEHIYHWNQLEIINIVDLLIFVPAMIKAHGVHGLVPTFSHPKSPETRIEP